MLSLIEHVINNRRKITKTIILCVLAGMLGSCNRVWHKASIEGRNVRIGQQLTEVDEEVAKMIRPYRINVSQSMDKIIGFSTYELTKDKPNSTLGNWFVDAMLEEMIIKSGKKLDFAIQNYGGIRIPVLAAGDITVGKIYELMPFDNIAYLVDMPGSIVKEALDIIAEKGGMPLSHSVTFTIVRGKAEDIKINQTPLDNEKIYTAVIPDYVYNGGDDFKMLAQCQYTDTGIYIRDLLIDNVSRLGQKNVSIPLLNDERIR